MWKVNHNVTRKARRKKSRVRVLTALFLLLFDVVKIFQLLLHLRFSNCIIPRHAIHRTVHLDALGEGIVLCEEWTIETVTELARFILNMLERFANLKLQNLKFE